MVKVNVAVAIAAMKNKELPVSVRNTEKGCELTYLNSNPIQLDEFAISYLNKLCLRYGSTLEGRLEACRYLLSITQKACLLISERSEEVYFPVKGLSDRNNEWFLFSSIVTFHSLSDNRTELIFTDGTRKVTDVNYRTVRMQMERSKKLILMLDSVK